MLSLIGCVEMSHVIKSDRKPQNVLNKAILHYLICFAKKTFSGHSMENRLEGESGTTGPR